MSINDQHYVLIITPLFDTQAPTCFGIHVPPSGSFLCPYELLESRNVYAVCHVLNMLLACAHWLLCAPVVDCCVHWLLCALVVVVPCVTLSS
jgi:hypothetical protein